MSSLIGAFHRKLSYSNAGTLMLDAVVGGLSSLLTETRWPNIPTIRLRFRVPQKKTPSLFVITYNL